MKKNPASQLFGLTNPRFLIALALCSVGILLGLFSFASIAAEKRGGMEKFNPAGPVITAPTVLGGSWTVTPSPNAGAQQFLKAVACSSTTDCWAVGGFPNANGVIQTLIEHWDGVSWSTVASPNTSAAQDNVLNAVSCRGMNSCWAVGSFENAGGVTQTLIERWNGVSWAIFASANSSATQNNTLASVTCITGTDCWTVGNFVNAGGFEQTLTEHWNGAAWTITASPNTSATQNNRLTSVSCSDTDSCRAVGRSVNAGGFEQTLAERWNGTSWLVVASPNTSATQNNNLASVSCAAADDCRAVGYFVNAGGFGQTLTERWNGSTWAIVASPNTSATDDNRLESVHCIASNGCRAVGRSIGASGFAQTLTERWNGTAWAIVASANTSATRDNFLNSVYCVASTNDCWAVGSYANDSEIGQPLIEHRDSTAWTIFNVSISQSSVLNDTTCVAASDCWAVGYNFNANNHQQTLIERWNGTAWSIVMSPSTSGNDDNVLTGVSCASATDCWAVGSSSLGTQTLTEHWNGSGWSIFPSPNVGTASAFTDVFCAATDECWAVGYSVNGGPSQTLIEEWDGKSWAVVSSPNASANANALNGVTCAAALDCWAVGYFNDTDGVNKTLTERWDGKGWNIVTSPNGAATSANELKSVTCVSGSDCWAAGRYLNQSVNQTLIEHWNGSAWSLATSPNTSGAQNNYLNSITCALGSYCWAVGDYLNGSTYSTLTEQWDGTAWTIVSSPNSGAQSNFLNGVTCSSATTCWAVGYFSSGTLSSTLIEKFTLAAPLLTSASSRKTHGLATFDINLPLTGNHGVECRNGTAAQSFTIVFTFDTTITSVSAATVTAGTGNVSSHMVDSGDAHNYIVNLTGVANAQTVTVTLTNVLDTNSHTASTVSASVDMLLGDTSGNRSVNATDVSQTQFESGNTVTTANFREDVTANGGINSSDVSTVQAQSGTGF